mgnify:CR=1 FL=1
MAFFDLPTNFSDVYLFHIYCLVCLVFLLCLLPGCLLDLPGLSACLPACLPACSDGYTCLPARVVRVDKAARPGSRPVEQVEQLGQTAGQLARQSSQTRQTRRPNRQLASQSSQTWHLASQPGRAARPGRATRPDRRPAAKQNSQTR